MWEEALDNKFQRPTKKDLLEIGMIMQGLEGWDRADERKRVPKYGLQRLWKRRMIVIKQVGAEPFLDMTGAEVGILE